MVKLEETLQLIVLGVLGLIVHDVALPPPAPTTFPHHSAPVTRTISGLCYACRWCPPLWWHLSSNVTSSGTLSQTPQLKIALAVTRHHLTWLFVSVTLIIIQYYLTYVCIYLWSVPASQRMEAFWENFLSVLSLYPVYKTVPASRPKTSPLGRYSSSRKVHQWSRRESLPWQKVTINC